MLSVEQVVTERFPTFVENKPKLITKPTMGLLRLLFHEKETNRFLEEHKGLAGLDFIEKVLEYFSPHLEVRRRHSPLFHPLHFPSHQWRKPQDH